ncbi:MAG: cation diffusion facilitator family transporter [Clostridia bacterium]
MKLIKKCFIKDYKNTENALVRVRYGIVAGILGIISNSILFLLKIVVGVIGNSITIIADAINNLSDAGSSVVTVCGFKMSARPADKEHPYGHARYEYITALIVAFIVLAIGILLGKSSIEKIISPEAIETTIFTYVVLGLAIVMKIWQMLLYIDFGKSINSTVLKACSEDSRNDVLTTTAVLLATIIMDLFDINIDGYVGLAVSMFIVISTIKLVKETIDPLLGVVPDKDVVNKLKVEILNYDGVLGIHDLILHSYGAAHCFAVVHVEVSAKDNILKSHDLMDNIERDIKEKMNITLSIHMDPVETDNKKINEMKEKVANALTLYNPQITIHDFRVVSGVTHTNVLFDAATPFGTDVNEEDIEKIALKAIDDGVTKYYFVINLDKSYV